MTVGLEPSALHPFMGQDLPHLLENQAARRGDHPFLIYHPFAGDPQTWSYAAFHEAVTRLAGGLAARGVGLGQPVLIHMDNCIEFLMAWHACSRLGAVAVTTNTRSSVDELAYFISHSGARIALTEPCHAANVIKAGPDLAEVACTATDGGETPDTPRPAGLTPFEDLAAGDPALAPLRAPEPFAFNSVQYTSGSTSRPKGVVWTHANALWGGRMGAFACQVGPEDIGHACLPLYHTNALSYSHLSTLWAGATLVFQRRFSASRFWDCVTQHGCTWGIQIPFTLKALMAKPVPANSFRLWGLGGVDPPTVLAHFGIPSLGWFGMTETVSLPLVSTTNLKSRIGSMGTPTPGYEIEVRDDAGAPVGFGETGHLWIRGVRGLSLFQEYLNDPTATAAAFDERGWFKTGDRVSLHRTGVTFEGRDRDMLRVGAENVAESEIERVLLATGLVAEVAVVGKPHPMLDETPMAFVIAAPGSADPRPALFAACADKLASFKRPETIVLVEDLPRVTLGKIDKKILRQRAAELAREERSEKAAER